MGTDATQGLQILVADDHAIIREALKRLLESATGAWTVVEVGSGWEALDQLHRRHFDVAIVDFSMPGMPGLDLLPRVRLLQPDLPVLILSMHAEKTFVRRALEAGARGYVTKDTAARELVDAVRQVVAGGVYVSTALADPPDPAPDAGGAAAPLERLTHREVEVLRRLVEGQRPTEIAQALNLSIKTVSSHKSHIQTKLQLPHLAALVRFGLEHGLVDDDDRARPAGVS